MHVIKFDQWKRDKQTLQPPNTFEAYLAHELIRCQEDLKDERDDFDYDKVVGFVAGARKQFEKTYGPKPA